jgi:hypothetical protein
MNPRYAVLTFLALCAACGAEPADDAAAPARIAAPQSAVLASDQAKPPFSRETVIRLNEIVSRSLAAIRAYDGAIGDIRAAADAAGAEDADAAVKKRAAEGLAQVEALYADAAAALSDMRAAVDDLKTGGEDYNDAILAGMVDFVEDVERELGAEKQRLEAQIGA